MKKGFGALLLTLSCLLFSPQAFAGKNDDLWAQCIWDKVPTSAANWLSLPFDKNENASKPSRSTLLSYRLRAACHKQMIPEGKDYPTRFNTKAVRASLERIKPAEIGPDKIDPRAYQCVRFFLNDTEMKNPAAYDWAFGDFDKGTSIMSVYYQFAAEGGGAVGLTKNGGLKKCSFISDNGSLIDA